MHTVYTLPSTITPALVWRHRRTVHTHMYTRNQCKLSSIVLRSLVNRTVSSSRPPSCFFCSRSWAIDIWSSNMISFDLRKYQNYQHQNTVICLINAAKAPLGHTVPMDFSEKYQKIYGVPQIAINARSRAAGSANFVSIFSLSSSFECSPLCSVLLWHSATLPCSVATLPPNVALCVVVVALPFSM